MGRRRRRFPPGVVCRALIAAACFAAVKITRARRKTHFQQIYFPTVLQRGTVFFFFFFLIQFHTSEISWKPTGALDTPRLLVSCVFTQPRCQMFRPRWSVSHPAPSHYGVCVCARKNVWKTQPGTVDRKSHRKTRRVPTLGASLARLCLLVFQQFFFLSASTSRGTTLAVAVHVSFLNAFS